MFSSSVFLLDEPEPAESQQAFEPERAYTPDVIEQVWWSAQTIPGNDSALWRKDAHGAWIHRLAYRNRQSDFGWEIADCAYTLRAYGIAALRPMQWQNHLDFLVASRSSYVTSDGLRNARKLL